MATVVAAGTAASATSPRCSTRARSRWSGASDDPAKWGHHVGRAAALRAARSRGAPREPARRHGAGPPRADPAARGAAHGSTWWRSASPPRGSSRRSTTRSRRAPGRSSASRPGCRRPRRKAARSSSRRCDACAPPAPCSSVPTASASSTRPPRCCSRPSRSPPDRSPCSRRAATSSSTSTTCWPGAGWASRASCRWATRPTSRSPSSCAACVEHQGTTRRRGVRRGRPRRPRVRRGGARAAGRRQARRAAGAGAQRGGVARGRLAHRLADQPRARDRRRLRGRREFTGWRRPHELVDALAGLIGPRRAVGVAVAVLTDGGGHGAIAADAVTAVGLEVPQLSDAIWASGSATVLWEQSTVSNPVDLAGVGEQDPSSYARGRRDAAGLRRGRRACCWWATSAATPTMPRASPSPRSGRRTRSPRSSWPAQAGGGALHLPAQRERARARGRGHPGAPRVRGGGAGAGRPLRPAVAQRPRRPLELPAAAGRCADTRLRRAPGLCSRLRRDVPGVHGRGTTRPGSHAALAPETLRYPLVLKAMGLLHKSDAGGVVLGLRAEAERRGAYRDLRARLDPPAVTRRGDGRPPGRASR